MAALPQVPYFPSQDTSLANLNALAANAALVSGIPCGWFFSKTITQSLAANAAGQVLFGTSYFDPDADHASNGAVVSTPGYYDCEATVPFSQNSAGGNFQFWLQVTSGANNPAGSGVVTEFGMCGDIEDGNTSEELSVTIQGTSPMLYIGDSVQVWYFITVAATVSFSYNASGQNDIGGNPDGGAYFTGQLISEGP